MQKNLSALEYLAATASQFLYQLNIQCSWFNIVKWKKLMSIFSDGRRDQASCSKNEMEREQRLESRAREAVNAINKQSDGLLVAELGDNDGSVCRSIDVFIKGKTEVAFASVSLHDNDICVYHHGNSVRQTDKKSINGMLMALGGLYEKYYENS